MTKIEPIEKLFNKYKYNYSEINKIIIGKRYCAIKLKNGNIGVCATLKKVYDFDLEQLKNPDTNNYNHRIFIAAYYNAKLNYDNYSDKNTNIIKNILDAKYKNIVMIGHFKPILQTLEDNNVKVALFDYLNNDPRVLPQNQQKEYLKKSDAVILSATSIYNNTFLDITENTSDKCDIFVLGPSSLMHPEIFDYKNIKASYGTIFKNNDNEILEMIHQGDGTRTFMKYAKKAVFRLQS